MDNRIMVLMVIFGLIQVSVGANVTSMNITPHQGLGDLVAVDYQISVADTNITDCWIYNPFAVTIDSGYYWEKQQSGSDVIGQAVFKKTDQVPLQFKCSFMDSTYQSRDFVVTSLRIVDGLQIILLILGMLICLYMFFTHGGEIIWGVASGVLFLVYNRLVEASYMTALPEYGALNGIIKIGLGLVFAFMIFRALNDDLGAILSGPKKAVKADE